jgi:hypothetical protein
MNSAIRGRVVMLAAILAVAAIPALAHAQGIPPGPGGYCLVATGTSGTGTSSNGVIGSPATTTPGAVSFSLPRIADTWFQFRWMLSPARPNTRLSAHALRERRASR